MTATDTQDGATPNATPIIITPPPPPPTEPVDPNKDNPPPNKEIPEK